MVKKVFFILLVVFVAVLLTLAMTRFNRKPSVVCNAVDVSIMDSTQRRFITEHEIRQMLRAKHLYPEKMEISEVNTAEMEKIIGASPIVKRVECYHTANGNVRVQVWQRNPVMRVIAHDGGNYYIDDHGEIMERFDRAAYVPLFTGYVDRQYACRELLPLALYLRENAFWDQQINQIHVNSDEMLELTPRVGNHVVFFGKVEGYEEKFAKLMKFYRKVLNEVGWNKYSRISMEFDNQIICTKR